MSKMEKIREKLYTENEYGFEHQDLNAKLTEDEKQFLQKEIGLVTDYRYPTGDVVPVHDMCVNCQARQWFKYQNHVDKKGNKYTRFGIDCSFVPGAMPPGSRQKLQRIKAQHDIGEAAAQRILKSGFDPVSWTNLLMGFKDPEDDDYDEKHDMSLRPYQREQLRCTSKRLVVREGRRSGKTAIMALKLIYMAFNHKIVKGRDAAGKLIESGPEILVITPFQAQVTNLFTEIDKFLRRNVSLTEKVTTGTAGNLYVKTPFYKMEFDNGAKISGFVSGVGSKDDGSGGGSARGQSAHIVYMDEMDMIPDEILEAVITPILITSPDVMLYATSTPIGKRGKFYHYCFSEPGFKEDYFPSTVLPHWDKLKDELENSTTEEAFNAEYMADFIEGAYGVFKPSFVYRAMGAFTYKDCDLGSDWWRNQAGVNDRQELMKVVGIDWNKNAGTEIVVVAYDPNQHHWWVAESVNISAGEFSAQHFKEEVIRINFKWKPDYIYADEGYGHHIIEDLKLISLQTVQRGIKTIMDKELAALGERLKAFNFSQKVELRSPIDGVEIKKTGKEFLVENAVRVFEEGRIWFPETDHVLLNQLLNYVVLRRGATTNRPVYGSSNKSIGDHRLDALMLALGGLFLEESMYSPNSGPDSEPVLLTKKHLTDRSKKLLGANQTKVPRALDMMRSNIGREPVSRSEFRDPVETGSKTQSLHDRWAEVNNGGFVNQRGRTRNRIRTLFKDRRGR